MPSLYLIDGSSYLYRAFYAIRNLTAPDGTPTNAVYGFMNMIMKIIREKRPDYFAIVFDAPGPTHRHEAYDQYKANRPGMPDDLLVQLPVIKDIIGALRIRTIEKKGFEADDILALLAQKGESGGLDVFVATGDKDLCQIVTGKIKLYDTMKEKITEEADVVEKYGVMPSQFPEVLALMGDTSDNIPGAPGIGEKTAVKLLKEFGDLEGIIANAASIKNARARNAVTGNIDSIRLSLDLATLHPSVPLDIEIDELRLRDPDWPRVLEYFRSLRFTSLVKLVPDQQTEENTDINYNTILDIGSLASAMASVKGEIAIDTETTSPVPVEAELVGISFSSDPARASYIPLRHTHPDAPDQLGVDQVVSHMKGLLEDEGVAKIGHNIKYDLIVLMRSGIVMEGLSFDTMIASYLLDPNRTSHSLASVAMEYLGIKKKTFKDVMPRGARDFAEVSVRDASVYSGEDSAVTLRLKNYFQARLSEEGLLELFETMEMPLVKVLADMEMTGILIDTSLMQSYSRTIDTELESLEKRIYFLAGEEFNINSPKQLQEILFEKIGLKPLKRTKTGYSTNMEVLEQLALKHDLPGEIIEYRGLAKLKNTYLDALPRLVNVQTGRLHTSFNQTVTATGRLSSSDPNLQNIPVRGAWGRKIRKAFIAEEGMVLLSSDYSQIELRVFAHLSEDELLLETFSHDGDIHTRTACELFDVKPDRVTEEMRRRAKTVNFGIVYGISPYGLSRQLNIPADEAKSYIESYFLRHKGVREYIDSLVSGASTSGFVTTLFCRKRGVPESASSKRNVHQISAQC